MRPPSRRQLLAGVGSAVLAGTAGCLGFDVGGNRELERSSTDRTDESTTPTWEMPNGLPERLTTALRFVFPPGEDVVFPDGGSPAVPTDGRPPVVDSPDGASAPTDWLALTVIDHKQAGYDPALTVSHSDVLYQDDRRDDGTDLAWEVQLNLSGLVDGTEPRTIWVGESLAGAGDPITTYDDFRVYTVSDQLLATDGTVGLFGEADWVEKTLAQAGASDKPYVVQYPRVATVLAELKPGGEAVLFDTRAVVAEQFGWLSGLGEPETLLVSLAERPATAPARHRTYTFLGYYPDGTPESAGETLTELGEELAKATPDAEELTTDDQFAKLSVSYRFVPSDERLKPPDNPVLGGYDPEDRTLEFVFQDGDEIETEYLSLEIESDPYDGEWLRGQETLGKGDSIVVGADAVEPGDDLTVRYERPELGVSDGASNTVLTTLPFEYVYEPETKELTATYGDGPPLAADRLSGGPFLGDQRDFTEQIDGELRMGKRITLTEIDRDYGVELRYERSDARMRAVAYFPTEPPGVFDFEREEDLLRVTYSTAEPVRGNPIYLFDSGSNGPDIPTSGVYKKPVELDADSYELRVDGAPAETQWNQQGNTIAEGDSLAIEGVSFGEGFSLVWVGQSGEVSEMASHVVLPEITFKAKYHESAEAVTLSHAGGDAVPSGGIDPSQSGAEPHAVNGLEIQVHADGPRLIPWPGDVVAPGDSVLVTDVPVGAEVVLTIGNAVLVAFNTRQLRDADEPVTQQTEQAAARDGGPTGITRDELT